MTDLGKGGFIAWQRCLMSAYYTHMTYWDPMLLFSGVKRETHMQILHVTSTSYKEQNHTVQT